MKKAFLAILVVCGVESQGPLPINGSDYANMNILGPDGGLPLQYWQEGGLSIPQMMVDYNLTDNEFDVPRFNQTTWARIWMMMREFSQRNVHPTENNKLLRRRLANLCLGLNPSITLLKAYDDYFVYGVIDDEYDCRYRLCIPWAQKYFDLRPFYVNATMVYEHDMAYELMLLTVQCQSACNGMEGGFCVQADVEGYTLYPDSKEECRMGTLNPTLKTCAPPDGEYNGYLKPCNQEEWTTRKPTPLPDTTFMPMYNDSTTYHTQTRAEKSALAKMARSCWYFMDRNKYTTNLEPQLLCSEMCIHWINFANRALGYGWTTRMDGRENFPSFEDQAMGVAAIGSGCEAYNVNSAQVAAYAKECYRTGSCGLTLPPDWVEYLLNATRIYNLGDRRARGFDLSASEQDIELNPPSEEVMDKVDFYYANKPSSSEVAKQHWENFNETEQTRYFELLAEYIRETLKAGRVVST